MSESARVQRRGVIAAAVGGAALGGLGGATVAASGRTSSPAPPQRADRIAFHGPRQAGIQTPAQAHLLLLGINLDRPARDPLRRLLALLSDDAARLTQGLGALADTEPELAQDPARLTITFGLSHRLLAAVGGRPGPVIEPMKTDRLRPRWGQTDLLVQLGADSLTSLAHARAVLTKDLRTLATLAWVQTGFRNPAGAGGGSMRNLMGQVDGTVNPRTAAEFDDLVWDRDGGTEVVLRRIEMDLEAWERADREARDFALGRRQDTGAPLTGRHELDPPDFAAKDQAGFAVIDPASHLRRARGSATGPQFLRRGYNYDDAVGGAGEGSGLLFLAYARSLARQYLPAQRRIDHLDLLNRWLRTVGSAAYWVPPGAERGSYVGAGLFKEKTR